MFRNRSLLWGVTICMALCLVGCLDGQKQDRQEPEMNLLKGPWSEMSQAAMPRLFSDGSVLYTTWVSAQGPESTLFLSQYQQGSWSVAEAIQSGDNWFVNWADFPQVAVNNGAIFTTYLEKSAGTTYAYDIRYNVFNSKTQLWVKGLKLHRDTTKTEHGFVSVRPYGDGFLAAWLDGRETTGNHQGAMTIRAAKIAEDATLGEEMILDERVCDCCQTALVTGDNQEVMVVYRDRSQEEIRDISVVSMTDQKDWTVPISVGVDGWKIAGCPVNGPAIDSYKGHSAVAWFSAPNEEAQVKVAFAQGYQGQFGPAIRMDSGNATGRVNVVMLNETEAAVLWMEPQGEKELLRLQKVSDSGQKGKMVTIAETSADRASGFPQLARVHDRLFVAYTLNQENASMFYMTSIDLAEL